MARMVWILEVSLATVGTTNKRKDNIAHLASADSTLEMHEGRVQA